MLGYNQVGIAEARPPYIAFERRPVERRKTIEEGGAVYYVDVDFALVTSHGAKDTTEKIVEEWFPYLQEQARQGRYPQTWVDVFKANYQAWKNDQEPPVNGTPIKTWPAASPAEIKTLLALRVLAVEDLAAGNEELLQRLGMGGRSLKKRAADWLAAKQDKGPLIQELDAQRNTIEGLMARLVALEEANKQLKAELAAKPAAPQPIQQPVYGGLPRAPAPEPSDEGDLVDDAIQTTLG